MTCVRMAFENSTQQRRFQLIRESNFMMTSSVIREEKGEDGAKRGKIAS